jgi:hypothetical protein
MIKRYNLHVKLLEQCLQVNYIQTESERKLGGKDIQKVVVSKRE